MRRLVRRLTGLGPGGEPAQAPALASPLRGPTLGPADFVRIRQLTQERLLATGLPAERAALVADAVIGALVIADDGRT